MLKGEKTLDPTLVVEVIRLFRESKYGRVEGIKLIRKITGLGLRKCKELADNTLQSSGDL